VAQGVSALTGRLQAGAAKLKVQPLRLLLAVGWGFLSLAYMTTDFSAKKVI
jgi:hypothetical protein